jgi:integrase
MEECYGLQVYSQTGEDGIVALTASITRRNRRRRLKSGAVVVQTRFVVNFHEPGTGRRKQFFFARYREAIAKRDALLSSVVTGMYAEAHSELTVAQAVEYWIEIRRSEVKKGTWNCYRQLARYIVGPLLVGTPIQRRLFTQSGETPRGAQFLEMLGPIRIADLSTSDIRRWHRTLTCQVSSHTATVAKKLLRAALALTAEDYLLRVPPMPTLLGRGRTKSKKAILTPSQVGRVLEAAQRDEPKGIYYAFPFLTGVRPSEQLALLWQDIDFDAGVIRVQRMQEVDGSITEFTKTSAGIRDIPMSLLLKTMLLRWRSNCPRASDALHRVFPALGNIRSRPGRTQNVGGPLTYANFRVSYWRPVFAELGLPVVTPHSARHVFISTLQAQGIEVGLVAKLAGHANATVTLAHYTHAVRGGEIAVQALERAFTPQRKHSTLRQ